MRTGLLLPGFVGALALAQHDVITPETSIVPADHPAIQYNEPPQDDAVATTRRQYADWQRAYEKKDLTRTMEISAPDAISTFGGAPDSDVIAIHSGSTATQVIRDATDDRCDHDRAERHPDQ